VWSSVVLFAGVAAAASAYHSLLRGVAWWFIVVAAVAITMAAMTATRVLSRRKTRKRSAWEWLAPGVGVVIAAIVLTVFFAPAEAILAAIPSFDSTAALVSLGRAGADSIATQGIPAAATPGIVFLMTAGFASVAIVLDVLTFTVRWPSVAGIPLLVLVAVPGFIDSASYDPLIVALVAAAYLALLGLSAPVRSPTTALGVGAVAVVGAIVVSVVVPSVLSNEGPTARSGGFTTGINPFVNLGEDLRRSSPVTAISYTTDADDGQYFTLTVLEQFTGDEWRPVVRDSGNSNLAAIDRAPGRAPEATTVEVNSDVTVGNIESRWLPLPYSPTSVRGLNGEWRWSPQSLMVLGDDASARGQTYTVASDIAQPTARELAAAPSVRGAAFDRFLALPTSLPDSIGERAREVTRGLDTDFEKARALQSYFRSGEFDYSEEAPVEQGYDGSSGDVIATFLEVKAGYCVHFASAMATMARTLDIPARIAVGFTPGEVSRDIAAGEDVYTVSTDDLHAWPELYFGDAGWVRFEPTPGRGSVPQFGSINDATTPQDDETESPSPTPTATDAATPTPTQSSAAEQSAAESALNARAIATTIGILVAVLLVLATPFAIRRVRRSRRISRVRATGSAAVAWSEVRDTATDYGWAPVETETPLALAARLDPGLTPDGRAALGRLLAAVQSQAFDRPGNRIAASADDVLVAVRSLGVRSGTRFRATFAPASVLGIFGPKRSPTPPAAQPPAPAAPTPPPAAQPPAPADAEEDSR
jgi:transglutaminase-like putative cysteine protease